MLVLDLDGTTLTHDKRVIDADKAAVARLQAAGIHVSIATGRLFTGTRWVAKALGIDGAIAVMNGCEVRDVETGACQLGDYVPAACLADWREEVCALGVPTFLFMSDAIHLERGDQPHTAYLRTWTEDLQLHRDIASPELWERDDVLALCAAGSEQEIEAICALLQPRLPPPLGTVTFDTYTGERFVQVMSTRHHKGTAVGHLARLHGLTPADVVVVGDWLNDEPMFRVAGQSYAMSHAIDALKQMADGVLDAGAEGGAVAEVARRVWEI
jgi:Cof subfamily protein (haloacid dehalogenase superfamily)